MPKFQIGTPGGYEVEIAAATEQEALSVAEKNWQTLPRIIAKSKDQQGRVFERRDGQRYFISPGYSTSNPKLVERIISGLLDTGTQPDKSVRDQADDEVLKQFPTASRGSAFVRGVPFAGSYADEAAGAILGQDARDTMRAVSGAQERQRPGETMALNAAGGVTASAAALAMLPEAVTAWAAGPTGMRTIPSIMRGAAIGAPAGAVEGAISGYGEGTTPESRRDEAYTGALFGGGAGLAGGAVAPIIGRGAKGVIDYVRRSDLAMISGALGISSNAAKVIKNVFDQGGDLSDAMQNLMRAGDEAMLVDAGPAAQALLDAAAASGGEAGRIARSEVENRATRTSGRLSGYLDNRLGAMPEGPQSKVAEIAQRTAPQRKQAYDAAYAQPIDYASPNGMAIEDVLRRVPPADLRRAITEANKDIIADPSNTSRKQIIARFADDGTVQFAELPNVQQLDYLKRALGTQAEAARGPLGQNTQPSRRNSMLADDLRTTLGNAVDGYNTAVGLGGDKLAEERAFVLGRNLLRDGTEIEDVTLELGKQPSAAAREAARSGLRSYLGKLVGDVKRIPSDPNLDARQLLAELRATSSDNSRAKIRKLLGQDEADQLFKVLDEADQSMMVRSALAVNSKTQQRSAIQGAVKDITAPGVIGSLMNGEPLNTSKRLIQIVSGQTEEFSVAQQQKVYQDIAKALTGKRGESARAALNYLRKALDGQKLTEAQNSFTAQQIALAFQGATVPEGSDAAQRTMGK